MNMKRDAVIKKIHRDWNLRKSAIRRLMGNSMEDEDGYRLTRAALADKLWEADLDDLLINADDGDTEVDAVLCQWASRLLFRLAETDPPPLKWFPKELAIFASVKLSDLGNTEPPRHKGTNSADYATRDFFILCKVLEACKALDLKPTRNTATGHRDSGCSIVAEALELEESAVNKIWRNRKRFGWGQSQAVRPVKLQ
jgi:hypothetical protein